MEKQWYEKKYQVIFVDEYNNFWEIGWFDDLAEAEPDLNNCLDGYRLENDDGELTGECPKFGEGENLGKLNEYPSTLSPAFDRIIATDCGCVQVRGFVRESGK